MSDWTTPIYEATARLIGVPVGSIITATEADADYTGSGTYAVAFDGGRVVAMQRLIPECYGGPNLFPDMGGGRRALEFAAAHPVAEIVLAIGSGYELSGFFKPEWLD